jgi:hypothetical protein
MRTTWTRSYKTTRKIPYEEQARTMKFILATLHKLIGSPRKFRLPKYRRWKIATRISQEKGGYILPARCPIYLTVSNHR